MCVYVCVIEREREIDSVCECLKRDVKDHFIHPNRVFILRRKMLTLHIWENVEVTLPLSFDMFVRRRRKEGETFPMP